MLEKIGFVVVLIAVMFALILVLTFPLVWIANYTFNPNLLAAVFGVPYATFWKMLAFESFVGLMTINYHRKD